MAIPSLSTCNEHTGRASSDKYVECVKSQLFTVEVVFHSDLMAAVIIARKILLIII